MARILVVDDEIESCKMLEEFLCSKGYDVFWALSTDEAIKIVKKEKPQLVLLDIIIPEKDGLECLARIKEIDNTIEVIMVTAVKDEEKAMKAMDLGAFDYITKPIDLYYLENSIMFNVFMHTR